MRLSLTGEQKRILTLPFDNPIQIKGVAGSGKTTVAIYRAMHLDGSGMNLFRATHVCIFSYTKSLIKYIQSIIDEEEQGGKRITVTNFHKWAYSFLHSRNFWSNHKVASNGSIESIITNSLAKLRQEHNSSLTVLNKPVEFYKEEFAWIKGRELIWRRDYLETKRTGRGTADRITTQDKELLWTLYSLYCQALNEKNEVDFDDFALKVLNYIEREKLSPPFSHIVVDEAQDLSVAQLRVITKLVNRETNSLTIIADAAQRIYKSGFAWSDVGINVRGGRTVELKQNYRNTRQIAEAAISLLSHDPHKIDFSEHILPERQGPKPKAFYLPDKQQVDLLIKYLQPLDFSLQSAVVLHRNRAGVAQLAIALQSTGFKPINISANNVFRIMSIGLFVCTMSSVKGLEFDHVFLCDMNDDIIPYPVGFIDENDELHISTERRLVYTCMTRARHTLYLISTGKPSRYLKEIDPSCLETE